MITGASSGIGKETAKLFQVKNWHVAATMRSPGNAADLQRIADIECFRLDVTDTESIKQTIDNVLDKFGRIDVVLNNAGYGLIGAFETLSNEQIRRQLETNVIGVMNVCREILPYFREQKRGIIVNVTSISGQVGLPYSSVYSASKWAVEGFTEALQYEIEPFNVRVKLIEPGPIRTDFYDRSIEFKKSEEISVYDPTAERTLQHIIKGGMDAPDGSIVAQTIYDAVTDGSKKLRYGVNTKGMPRLKRLLPERVFYNLVKKIILR